MVVIGVCSGTVVIEGKSAGGNRLCVMHVAFRASTSRNMTHIYLESVFIVEGRILGDQETFYESAHIWHNAASYFECERPSVARKDIIHFEVFNDPVELVIEAV